MLVSIGVIKNAYYTNTFVDVLERHFSDFTSHKKTGRLLSLPVENMLERNYSATSVITSPIEPLGIWMRSIAAIVGAISVIYVSRLVLPGFTPHP